MDERTVTLADVVFTADRDTIRAFEAIYDEFSADEIDDAIIYLSHRCAQPSRIEDIEEYIGWFILGALWGRYVPGMGSSVTVTR